MIRKAIMSLISNVSLKSNMKSTEIKKNKQMVHEQKQMILNGKYK